MTKTETCRSCKQPIHIPCPPPYERLCTWCMAEAYMPAADRQRLKEAG